MRWAKRLKAKGSAARKAKKNMRLWDVLVP